MTTNELKSYFRNLMFVQTGKTDKKIDDLIDDAIIAGKQDFWAAYRWAFKETHDTITTTASTETVDLPENFDGILSVVEHTSANGVKLNRMTASEYDRLVPYSTSHSEGTPQYYKVYYDANDTTWKLALYPTPDSAISLYLTYLVMSDDGDAPKKYTAALVAAVGKYLTMPGSKEKQSAITEYNAEIERLKRIDTPDMESPGKFLTEYEDGQERTKKWWEDG